MKIRQYGFLVIAGNLLFSQSCNDDFEEALVEDEFIKFSLVEEKLKPYFLKFEEEGAKLGLEVDISAKNIGAIIDHIEEEHVVGRCSHSKDIKLITIDKLFWDRASDLAKEFVVFHELGHCYLRRGHLEDAFENGICASIMRSGMEDCLDNYNLQTRAYYIEELFFSGDTNPDIILADNN